MFDNLMLVAVIAIILWIGIYAFYMVTSRQQRQLQQDIEALDDLLKKQQDEK